ncbi:phage holin family protein [Egbenema bharatensis]|uniref:phage holin family protein n=1 Tax=Egbenema bharatensis TaxID=3463334 RepID=UPI003A8BBE55
MDDVIGTLGTYGQRSLQLVVRLVDLHLETAQRELAREQQRIVAAAIVLSIGATLLMTGFVLLQAFIVLFLYSRQQYWLTTAIGLLSFDFLIGILFLILGTRQLRGPYMIETIAQLTKTTSMLLEEE